MFNHSRRLKEKLTVAFIIVAVYILGQNIPLPYVRINDTGLSSDQTFIEMLQTINGSNRQTVSIFSLGIIPYMMASILLMLKNLGNSKKKRIQVISPTKQVRLLTLLICSVMAYLRTGGYEYSIFLFDSPVMTRLFTIIILVSGVFAIIWLADINTGEGIGGMVIIIVVNIIKNITRNILTVWTGFEIGVYGGAKDVSRILLLIVIGLASMFTILLFEGTEFRIPVQKVMIFNEMSEDNYMAFKLDPVGIQPIMYVMAFYIIPFYLFNILAYMFPDRPVFSVLASWVQLDNFIGIGLFVLLLFLLTLALALVQISPSDLAEQMQKSGDCIIGLRPGRETQEYIRKIVMNLSIVSSIILSALIALPLVLKIVWGLPQELAMIPMNFMFIGGISRTISLEIRIVSEMDSYQEVL